MRKYCRWHVLPRAKQYSVSVCRGIGYNNRIDWRFDDEFDICWDVAERNRECFDDERCYKFDELHWSGWKPADHNQCMQFKQTYSRRQCIALQRRLLK